MLWSVQAFHAPNTPYLTTGDVHDRRCDCSFDWPRIAGTETNELRFLRAVQWTVNSVALENYDTEIQSLGLLDSDLGLETGLGQWRHADVM